MKFNIPTPQRFNSGFCRPASHIRLLLAATLLIASLDVARASALQRKYVILENALTPVDQTKHSRELKPLIVLWTPDKTQNLEEVYLGNSHRPIPAKVKIEAVGDHFTGELTLSDDDAARDGYRGGSWRFSGPLAADSGRGEFTVTDTEPVRRGTTQVWTVFDVGKQEKLRAWVPSGVEPVRGLFIYGNGAQGDARHNVINDWWLTFCRLHRLALVATGSYGPEDASGPTLQGQLSEVAQASGHPELESAPILFTGHSNGGQMAWEYNAVHPERIIAFTVSKGGVYSTKRISGAALRNPAILILGENDIAQRKAAITRLFALHRPDNAPWSMAIEPDTDHAFGQTANLWLPFFEWAVQARLPSESHAPTRVPPLASIDPATGVVVVQRLLENGEQIIMPVADYKGALMKTSWLPNESLAFAFLAFNTPRNDLKLTMEPSSGVLHSNDKLRIGITRLDSHAWKEARLLINGQAVANLTPTNSFVTIKVGQPGVYFAVVVGKPSAGGPVQLAGPLSWIVAPADL